MFVEIFCSGESEYLLNYIVLTNNSLIIAVCESLIDRCSAVFILEMGYFCYEYRMLRQMYCVFPTTQQICTRGDNFISSIRPPCISLQVAPLPLSDGGIGWTRMETTN